MANMSARTMSAWISCITAFFFGLGVLSTINYKNGRTLENHLQWSVCSTSSFNDSGTLTLDVQLPTYCKWHNIAWFKCEGDDAPRCVRDNNNLYSNHAWSCVIYQKDDGAIDCTQAPLKAWPDTRTKAHLQDAIMMYIFGFIFFTLWVLSVYGDRCVQHHNVSV
jgi:hypothetical protein